MLCSAIRQGYWLDSFAGQGCRPGSMDELQYRLGIEDAKGHYLNLLVIWEQWLFLARQDYWLNSLPIVHLQMDSEAA